MNPHKLATLRLLLLAHPEHFGLVSPVLEAAAAKMDNRKEVMDVLKAEDTPVELITGPQKIHKRRSEDPELQVPTPGASRLFTVPS